MINTYHTSVAPPPIPPRLNRMDQVFIPGPSYGHSKSLLRFLVGVVLLHLVLSAGGFIWLYHIGRKKDILTSAEEKAAFVSMEASTHDIMASMIVKQPKTSSDNPQSSGYLSWNMDQSDLRGMGFSHSTWVEVKQSGVYYVYARVSFSKGSKPSLASRIKLRDSESSSQEKEKDIVKAYCSLRSDITNMCTASGGRLIPLKAGNQLSVWVQDLSAVDYENEATTFGMYKL